MGQSYFKNKCPHCGHESENTSCWGFSKDLDKVQRCSNPACYEVFEVTPNVCMKSSVRGPDNPSKGVNPKLMKVLLAYEANQGKTLPSKGEQLFVKRGARYLPVANSGPPLP